MEICKTDTVRLLRLLKEAALIIEDNCRGIRSLDKSRQLRQMAKKIQRKKIIQNDRVMNKIKTYVITLSITFPKSHVKAGRKTFFKEAIINGIDGDHEKYEYQHFKIHTVRHNYKLWKKRIDEINAGKAILSIRQWTGKPYYSKQVEIRQLNKVGIQKLRNMDDSFAYGVNDEGNVLPIPLVLLSINDGLELPDFKEWFKGSKPTPDNPMAIIHFTDFKYFE